MYVCIYIYIYIYIQILTRAKDLLSQEESFKALKSELIPKFRSSLQLSTLKIWQLIQMLFELYNTYNYTKNLIKTGSLSGTISISFASDIAITEDEKHM